MTSYSKQLRWLGFNENLSAFTYKILVSRIVDMICDPENDGEMLLHFLLSEHSERAPRLNISFSCPAGTDNLMSNEKLLF